MTKVSLIYLVSYHANLNKCAANTKLKIGFHFTIKMVLNALAALQNMKVYFKKEYIS